MKIGMNGLVVLLLLVSATESQAAAPKSLIGTWKVKSVTIDGEAGTPFGPWAKGALWKMKKDGTATIGAFSDVKWTYDADEGEFTFKRPVIFGFSEKFVFSVTSQGKDVKLKFQLFLCNWEVVLTPD